MFIFNYPTFYIIELSENIINITLEKSAGYHIIKSFFQDFIGLIDFVKYLRACSQCSAPKQLTFNHIKFVFQGSKGICFIAPTPRNL